jgi:excisionase family DNA binding protein
MGLESPTTEAIAVTIPEAARRLSCSVRAIRALIWRGDLPYIKLGKRFVIRTAALQAYADRAEVHL